MPAWILSERQRAASYLPQAALLIATLALFFVRLDCPLLEPEETRYAEIPRQMLAADSWLVPVFHGQPYYDKPPLLYWLVMASYRVFGIHDWAARLVASGAAAGCVLATYWWGLVSVGRRTALAGAFMLCLSARYIHLGRMLTMNGLVALFVVLALGAAQRAVLRGKLSWRWWLLSSAACALGILSKGPVALVLTVVPIFAYQVWDPTTARPRPLAWLAYLAAALALASPWFIAVALRDPSFLGYFFWTHHVVRYVAPLDHAQPVWYYLPDVAFGLLPWTLLLPGGVRQFLQAKHWRQPGPTALFALSFIWCLTFYSASGCKRAGYILPAMPPLALLLGFHLDRLLPAGNEGGLWRQRLPSAFQAGVLVAIMGLGTSVAAVVTGLVSPAVGSLLAALAAIVTATLLTRFRSRGLAWGECGLLSFTGLLVGVAVLLPAYARKYSLRDEVAPFEALDDSVPVVCYPHRWDSVLFYLQREDVRAFASSERGTLFAQLAQGGRTLVFVKSDHSLQELLRDLPASLEFSPCSQRPWVTVGWVRAKR